MAHLSDKKQIEALHAYLSNIELHDDEVLVVCVCQDTVCEAGAGLVTDDNTTDSVGQ